MLAFEQLLCCVIFIIFNASIYMCLHFSGLSVWMCVCVCDLGQVLFSMLF